MISHIYDERLNIHTDLDLDICFEKALQSLNFCDYDNAIYFIDLAIDIAPKKAFYMFQKIKILFISKLYHECSNYIRNNILFLYHNCSLYIFSQILDYYCISAGCSFQLLQKIFVQENIPTIIATEYPHILNKEDEKFIEKAILAKKDGDYTTCINYCNLLIRGGTNNALVYELKAESHHLLGQYEDAILMYKKAILENPNNDLLYYTLGNIMMKLNKYPNAISYFIEATKISPYNVEYMTNLGNAYYKWKKYDSALRCFKRIITKKPIDIDSYLNIAEIYAQINQPKKAKKYYKRAIRLQKKHL